VVALADRLDTLVGFFSLGAKFQPTGSKDPFGLRRSAMGVVRIVLEGGIDVDLPGALRRSFELHGGAPEARPAIAALVEFLWDRAEHLLALRGLAYDEIAAARDATGVKPALDFGTALACATAIHAGRGEPSFLSVVLSYKRIVNILRDVGDPPAAPAGPEGVVEEAERRLGEARDGLARELGAARAGRDFAGALAALARFAAPLDRFFVEVLVMDPDETVRRRRLGLLAAIRSEVAAFADLAAVVVDKAELRARAGA
jgi:glycyl-tRNA synthetase beta chain